MINITYCGIVCNMILSDNAILYDQRRPAWVRVAIATRLAAQRAQSVCQDVPLYGRVSS